MTAHAMTPTPATEAPATPASTDAPAAPLLEPDQASDLLDLVVYEQVLGCIDLDELYHLEQSLALSATGLPGISHQRGIELAKLMLDRAFRRLPDDIRTYLRAVEALACNGCELCEQEACEAHGTRGPAGSRRGSRYKT